MSHFYGIIKGTRGEATRCGDMKSGYRAQIAGWGGCIDVRLSHNRLTGEDRFAVWLTPWGNGNGAAILLAAGKLQLDHVRDEGFTIDGDILHKIVEKKALQYMTREDSTNESAGT